MKKETSMKIGYAIATITVFCAIWIAHVIYGCWDKVPKVEVQAAQIEKCDNKHELDELRERINALIKDNEGLREQNERLVQKRVMKLRISAYTPAKNECDDDPHITANMTKVKMGIVAVSRDLFYEGWVFGREIYIEGLGVFTIEDLMGKTRTAKKIPIEKSIDVFMWSKDDAIKFGIKNRRVALLG